MKLKHLYENYDLARECLKYYDYDEKSLDRMLPHFRISSNALYPFLTKSGTVCFLRYSPIEEKPYNDIVSEIRIISRLNGRGFPAMEPYAMKDGSLSKQIDTQWGTFNVSCFRGIPGKDPEETEGTPEICYGYGKTLGRMHRLLKDYPFAGERRDHNGLPKEVRARFDRFGAPEYMSRELAAVSDALNALPAGSETYGIVHYDFEPENVLYDADSGSFGVIDFDDAMLVRA